MDAARWSGRTTGFKFPEHEPMRPSSIKSLLLVTALSTSLLQAQDVPSKIREIERKVLREKYQTAIDLLVDSSREGGVNPDIIGKRLQWVTLVGNQLEAGDKAPAANQEKTTENARMINDLAWQMVNSSDAGSGHPEIALKLADIAIELDGDNDSLKSQVLDTKARALFLLGRHDEAIAEQENAVAAASVEAEKAELEATLAAYRRNELPEVTSKPAATLGGVAYITEKLKRIIIPSVEFENTTLEEATQFLTVQCSELDTTEPDPTRKGVNFVLPRPAPKPDEGFPSGTAKPDAVRIKSLRLRNVPVDVLLRYICDATHMRYKVDDFAVTFVPQTAPEDLFTREFSIPLDFALKLNARSGANSANGNTQPAFIELLESAGINFDGGGSATLIASDTLMVINTALELDKIAQLIEAMKPGKR